MTTITKDDLFRAVLAMDVYHRGYNAGLSVPGVQIGNAYVFESSSEDDGALIGLAGTGTTDESIGFFAQAYSWNGTTVIAYRGTDDEFDDGATSDIVNGFGIGAEAPDGPQALAAINFYNSLDTINIELVGQSLRRQPIRMKRRSTGMPAATRTH